MNIQVNSDISLYWNKHIFIILIEQNYYILFSIFFCIVIIHRDRKTSLCIESDGFVLEFVLYYNL